MAKPSVILQMCAALVWLGLGLVVQAAPPPGYQLVWSDDFNGPALDTNKWDYWLPGRRREAVNVSNAVTVTNGAATLTTYTDEGKHYTGMISTAGKFELVHGYWEARISYADAPGMWSAFWL
jgi:beta-glucanase (GH16 family)